MSVLPNNVAIVGDSGLVVNEVQCPSGINSRVTRATRGSNRPVTVVGAWRFGLYMVAPMVNVPSKLVFHTKIVLRTEGQLRTESAPIKSRAYPV